MDRTQLLRVGQVARILNVSKRMVQNLCDQGRLVSIRLPHGRQDRRISLESVKVLLKEGGVEIDLSGLGGESESLPISALPCVLCIGVPDGVIAKLSKDRCSYRVASSVAFGCAIIGAHKPVVVVLDASELHDTDTIKRIRETLFAFVPDCTLILRCYDDPAMFDPRQQLSQALANDRLIKACDESATYLDQLIQESLNRKEKVSA